ncbi:MAG TPA: NAD(P)/FAD-dependent oxidoreductase [Candidatus Dormibacteraeota bacterium]|jgi:cation diffusion facilitator CzcD-associated flavoprotein CzcO|nr:NAD(P)/FAD-dependent oxidoreductase [Candidatus Dormibacteraeota bacterium]
MAVEAVPVEEFDAVVIGAGVTGLYALYRLRERGFSVRLYDDAPGVGGTWYWNRYPGARFDSESYTYAYSFCEELVQEWDWEDHYAGQPEVERYLNHVVDRFGMRQDIRLSSRVASAVYRDGDARWDVTLEDGTRSRARFLLTAVGILSAHYVPDFDGLADFEGAWCHTGRWPAEGMELAGKRVGVIGTGSTGVQLVPEIVDEVGSLTVFQRTANYCVPLRNTPVDAATRQRIKATYSDILQACNDSPGGFMYRFDRRSAMEVSRDERMAQHERLWLEPGFKKWLANFYDIMMAGPANDEYSEFLRDKIRARIDDPALAERLVPQGHMFSSKRPPCESGYYDVFNRPNVTLVDVRADPIERITPRGIRTASAEHALDVIVFATGYDAVTGALDRIEIRGENSLTLKEKFAAGPRTYLGLQSVGFPNLFTLNAAQPGGNYVRVAEPIVDWVVDSMAHMRQQGLTAMSPTPDAEEEWTAHVLAASVAKTLRTGADTWLLGANIPGKPRVLLSPPDSALDMRIRRAQIAEQGYTGFVLR